MRRAAILLLALVAAASAAPARASTSVAGTGEPAFTNTTTNTQFIGYNRFSSYYTFRPYYSYYVGTGGTNVFNEYGGYIGAADTASTGTLFANWQGVVEPLLSGQYYGICVTGRYAFSGSPEFPESQSSCGEGIISGKRAGTTIDRSRPVVSGVAVEGTATYTNKTTLALSGLYSDTISPPWPAVYICTKENVDPASACNGVTYEYNSFCSNAGGGASTVNNPFSCGYTVGQGSPDGPVTFCALAADASVPDVPGGADQFAGLTSSSANRSDPSCGYVIVDRAAPQLAITGGGTTATVGALQSLSASASDPPAGISPGSGLTGAYTWNWGDNTPTSSGVNASHTYTQAGTFQVTLTGADNAGNSASATRAITVTAPPAGGGTTGGGTTGGGTTGGGTTTGSGGTVTSAPTSQEIAKQVGGSGSGATQTTSAGTLDVLTAKNVRISAKLKTLPLAVTSEQAGEATFALIRAGRIVSQAGLKITKPGSLGFKLKLPKRLKAGVYRLKITFRATGAVKASARTVRLTFSGPKRAKKSARAAAAAPQVSGGGAATPALGTAAAYAPPATP